VNVQQVEVNQTTADLQVILLFDLAVSGRVAVRRAKELAVGLISRAATGSHVVVMTIEPFAGLHFICQGDAHKDKELLLKSIKKKVKERINNRIVRIEDTSTRTDGTPMLDGREANSDQDFFYRSSGSWYKRKTSAFLKAFKSLYFHLASQQGNKFVYLFSEGISNSIRDSLRGSHAWYDENLKESAGDLGRCGAVLMLINTRGTDLDEDIADSQLSSGMVTGNPASGEESLHILAEESGGKYIEGTKKQLLKRIIHLQQVYYEISFQDPPGFSGSNRDVRVESLRKGVVLVSLRSLEGPKNYRDMGKVEKEILAVNLITNNPLIKRKISYVDITPEKIEKRDWETSYQLKLDHRLKDKKLDLYKVRLTDDHGVREIINVKKKKVETKTGLLRIVFKRDINEDKKIETYFLLVEPVSNSLLLYGINDPH